MKIIDLLEVSAASTADDGGMYRCLATAKDNMLKHSTSHKDDQIRKLCKDTHAQLSKIGSVPSQIFDDPHTLHKILLNLHGEPNHHTVQSMLSALSSYSQSDND